MFRGTKPSRYQELKRYKILADVKGGAFTDCYNYMKASFLDSFIYTLTEKQKAELINHGVFTKYELDK